MNLRTAAQAIRDTVTMQDLMDFYGYKVRHGFICCPFHGEKTPSLKIYPGTGGWCCFGCGRKGSVIDFVKEHENCDFRTAVCAIDNAFHLGLMDPKENPMESHQHNRLQIFLDEFVSAVNAYCDALIENIEGEQLRDFRKLKELEEIQFGHAEDLTADDYTFLLTWKEEDQYKGYRIEKINEFKEEVAAWRRKARSPK